MTVGWDSFRDHFGYWLDQAAKGEHMLITRRGKPLARLIPPADQLAMSA
jgi:prevent-host-death family protein